jgi:phosphatidylserine decarboxylase
MIKFGSRVDVVLDHSARLNVKVGDKVKGGASILAYMPAASEFAEVGRVLEQEGAR